MGSTHFLVVWMEVWDGLGSTPGEYSSNMRVRLLRRNLADGAAPLGLRTPNLIPSPPLHSTAPSDHRRPAPSPASPPGSRSVGLAQRRPHLVRRTGPAWSAALEEPPARRPLPRTGSASPPGSRRPLRRPAICPGPAPGRPSAPDPCR